MLVWLRRLFAHPVAFHNSVWGSLFLLASLCFHLIDPIGFPELPFLSGGAVMIVCIAGSIFTTARLVSGKWNLSRWKAWYLLLATLPWVLTCSLWFLSAPDYRIFALLLAPTGLIVGFGVYRTAVMLLISISYFVVVLLGFFWMNTSIQFSIPNVAGALVFLLFYFLFGLKSAFFIDRESERGRLLRQSRRDQRTIRAEREKSERLLLNILPEEIAQELKENGSTVPRHFASASVLFTDFKGFTTIAESMEPAALVAELDRCFSAFDSICDRHGLEKLKTIGDSYMCAGGIPVENQTHAVDCVLAAMEMQQHMQQWQNSRSSKNQPFWELRLGIHTGDLIAGVVGSRKFAYDVWGDTVNLASRLESSGQPGEVNISRETYELVHPFFECEHRGKIPAKHKGDLDMYFVRGIRPELCDNAKSGTPGSAFQSLYDSQGKH